MKYGLMAEARIRGKLLNNFKNFLQFNHKNQLTKLRCRELMEKKCLDEGLALRLVSFNAKLTNFFF